MARRAGEVILRSEDDGRVICDRCSLADTLWRRVRGLIGKHELEVKVTDNAGHVTTRSVARTGSRDR